MKKLILLIIIVVAGWYVYKHYGHHLKNSVNNIKSQVQLQASKIG